MFCPEIKLIYEMAKDCTQYRPVGQFKSLNRSDVLEIYQ